MVNITETSNQNYGLKAKESGPAIHISALPTRQNPQADLSFSIPLQYNLGAFKKVDEVINESEVQNQWDSRMMPSFNMMNLKPLIANREEINLSELKYEIKNESNRVHFNEITTQAMEAEDILGKETVNEGQTISPDFEIRYQYQNENDKRFRDGFETSIIDESRNDYVCDGDFLCKNNFEKTDDKRSDFEACHLLDTNTGVSLTNYETNL